VPAGVTVRLVNGTKLGVEGTADVQFAIIQMPSSLKKWLLGLKCIESIFLIIN